jgi:prophage regulatory protein
MYWLGADVRADFWRRGMSEPDRIIRKADLPKFVGLRRTQIETLIARGEFPKPVRLSERAVGWVGSELAEWQRARIAERDGGDRG